VADEILRPISVAQMSEVDWLMVEDYGIVLLQMMENAGRSLAAREPIASFIRIANAAPTPRLALDLPSGLDGDLGVPLDPTIRADTTLTLAWPKAGLLTDAAERVVGDLYLADISVPAGVYRVVGVDPTTLFASGPIVRVRRTGSGWTPEPSGDVAT
jgi:hypothetical protein